MEILKKIIILLSLFFTNNFYASESHPRERLAPSLRLLSFTTREIDEAAQLVRRVEMRHKKILAVEKMEQGIKEMLESALIGMANGYGGHDSLTSGQIEVLSAAAKNRAETAIEMSKQNIHIINNALLRRILNRDEFEEMENFLDIVISNPNLGTATLDELGSLLDTIFKYQSKQVFDKRIIFEVVRESVNRCYPPINNQLERLSLNPEALLFTAISYNILTSILKMPSTAHIVDQIKQWAKEMDDRFVKDVSQAFGNNN